MMMFTKSTNTSFSRLRWTSSIQIIAFSCHISGITTLSSRSDNIQRRDFSTSNSNSIPVGIFLDMDNIVPKDKPFRRQEGAALIRPFRIFAKEMVQTIVQEGQLDYHLENYENDLDENDEIDYVTTIQAFANKYTQQWNPGEISDEDLMEQSYVAHIGDAVDFPGAIAQTGYDEDEVLRCGVCGARMGLSKKERARGLTERKKLDKHMKSLHDREQQKRQTRLKQVKSPKKKKKLLEGKVGDQMKRYKGSQVGLDRSPKGEGKEKSNDVFQVLKEEGVRVRSSNDVDAQLIRTATTWINQQTKKYDSETSPHGSFQDIVRGILVVVSEDSDFCDLLKYAREKGFCAVTATPRSEMQTKALTLASDVVIEANDETDDIAGLRAEAKTILGRDLMQSLPSPLILKLNG